jgi:hypothetical protein
MKRFAPLTLILAIACSVDDPAAIVQTPSAEVMAICNPYSACDLQNPPCSCPSGFLCAAGLCVRDDDPWTECYNNADCVTTSPPYSGTCWKPVCYFYTGSSGQRESGCGWETLSGGQACKKPNGDPGVCASGMDAGDCI